MRAESFRTHSLCFSHFADMITFICVPSEETGTEQFKSLVLYHK